MWRKIPPISNFFNSNWANEVVSRLKNDRKNDPADIDWDKLYEDGKQYMYNRDHYGYYTWYDWCCNEWGTKWNSHEPQWCLEEGILYFQKQKSTPILPLPTGGQTKILAIIAVK